MAPVDDPERRPAVAALVLPHGTLAAVGETVGRADRRRLRADASAAALRASPSTEATHGALKALHADARVTAASEAQRERRIGAASLTSQRALICVVVAIAAAHGTVAHPAAAQARVSLS